MSRKALIAGSVRGLAMATLLGAGFDLVPVDESAPASPPQPKPEPQPLPPSTMTRQQRRHAERQAFKRLPK